MCPGWWGTESTLYTRQKWSTTGWAQETFKTDQSMEATSSTAKKKTMIKPSPSLSHMHKRWQALLPLGMLAACKETRNPMTCFQKKPAKLQARCKLCFPAHASIPHSRNRGYRCLKNFLWKEKFITYKGNSLSKHFVLASAWGRGPQHSSLVKRYNEVHGSNTGSEDENILSYQFPYPHSVETNHNGRTPS